MKINDSFAPDTVGIFAGLPMAQYQAAHGLSKSRIDVLMRSPLDFSRIAAGTLKRETTEALEIGTVYHSALFEDKHDYVIRPDTYEAPESAKKDAPLILKPWNGNSTTCKLWLASNAGKTILSRAEQSEIARDIAYIRKHRHAAPILARPGRAELSFFAREEKRGFMLKGRADWLWLNPDGTVGIADLKTTIDATTRKFSREILERRYHVQAAQYRYILRRLGYELSEWAFIAFEKGGAPKCNVRRLSPQAIDKGEDELNEAFDLYYKCRLGDEWPDYHDTEENTGFIDLPDFAYSDAESLTGMTEAAEVAA